MREWPRTLNEYLKRYREDTKGTGDELQQADIALAIDRSQSLISKVERGLADLSTWEPNLLYKMLLAWRQTPAKVIQIADQYDLRALKEYIAETRRMSAVGKGGGRVRLLGVVSAGMLSANEVMENGLGTVGVPDAIADKYRLEDVFAVNVAGDSMLDDDAKRSIAEGSLVYFHALLAPEPGEIVCVYLPEHDQTVIKLWRPKAGYAVLASRNEKHEPIIVRDADEAILQGVYLTHIPETPRLR